FPGRCLRHNGALRNLQNDVTSIASVTAALPAGLSVLRLEFSAVTIVCQSIQAFVHLEDDVSALSSVPSVRASVVNIELPAESYVAVPAFSRSDDNFRSVCKHNYLRCKYRMLGLSRLMP